MVPFLSAPGSGPRAPASPERCAPVDDLRAAGIYRSARDRRSPRPVHGKTRVRFLAGSAARAAGMGSIACAIAESAAPVCFRLRRPVLVAAAIVGTGFLPTAVAVGTLGLWHLRSTALPVSVGSLLFPLLHVSTVVVPIPRVSASASLWACQRGDRWRCSEEHGVIV